MIKSISSNSGNFMEFVREWLVQFPNDNFKLVPRLPCLNDSSFQTVVEQKDELRRQLTETRNHISTLRNSLQRKEFTLIYLQHLSKAQSNLVRNSSNNSQISNLLAYQQSNSQHHQLYQEEVVVASAGHGGTTDDGLIYSIPLRSANLKSLQDVGNVQVQQIVEEDTIKEDVEADDTENLVMDSNSGLLDIDMLPNGDNVSQEIENTTSSNRTGTMLVNYRVVNVYTAKSAANNLNQTNQIPHTASSNSLINTQQNTLLVNSHSKEELLFPSQQLQYKYSVGGVNLQNSRQCSRLGMDSILPDSQSGLILSNELINSTPIKMYHCRFCSYESKYPWNVKTHEQIHLGVKPFECPHCKYRCGDASSMKKHARIHSGEKPYACSVCDYRCTMMSNLRSHMRIHTGEKPHACTVCDFRCSQASSLKSHYKTHFR